MDNSNIQQVPGRKGAIARLVILGIFVIIGLISSLTTLPHFAQQQGLGQAILEAIAGCGTIFLTGAFFWALVKWIGVVAPKSFGFANRFWAAWRPLTFFGVYIKACLWLIIGVVPCCIIGFLFPLVFNMTLHFAQEGIGFFSAMLLFLLGVVVTVVLAFVDICKLQQRPVLESAKAIFTKEK